MYVCRERERILLLYLPARSCSCSCSSVRRSCPRSAALHSRSNTHIVTHIRGSPQTCAYIQHRARTSTKDAGAGAPDGTRHPDEESCDVSRRKGRQEASSMRAENVFECILSFYTVRWLFPSLRSKGWRCPDSLSPGSLDCCRSQGGGGG